MNLENINYEIIKFRTDVSFHIYEILSENDIFKNIKQLKLIDEHLNQFVLFLDGNITIDKINRKKTIMNIQKIQKAIDKTYYLSNIN